MLTSVILKVGVKQLRGRFVSTWTHKLLASMTSAWMIEPDDSISIWPFPLDSNILPSSWKVVMLAHMSSELLKFQAWEWFDETGGEVVMGGDICVVNVTSLDVFANVVMSDVNSLVCA